MKTTTMKLTFLFASLMVVTLLLRGFCYAAIDLKTAVGIWLFDEGSGNVAMDISGKGNDGTLKNTKWVEGKFGKALEFNGTNACVQTGKKLLDGIPEFTIVLWAKPGTIVASRVGLVGQNDSPEFGFINPNTIQLWTPTAGGLDVPYPYPKDEWHHIAGVGSTKFTRVYIDGKVSEKQGNFANHGSSAFNVNIGGCGVYDPDGNWFTGILDEVAIFHAVLEEGDIKRVMDRGLAKELKLTAIAPVGKLALTWGHIRVMQD